MTDKTKRWTTEPSDFSFKVMVCKSGELTWIMTSPEQASRLADTLNAHEARIAELEEALDLLLKDVSEYPAWERPCHAVNVANAALARKEAP